MTHKIDVEIVTPKGVALRVTVDEISVPGLRGEFGILPGHRPLVSGVKAGLISYRIGSTTKKCAVSRGFCELKDDKFSLLVDDYIEKEAIDPVQVRSELQRLEMDLGQWLRQSVPYHDDVEKRASLISEIHWRVTQLELYGSAPYHLLPLLEGLSSRDAGGERANLENSDSDPLSSRLVDRDISE